MLPNIVEQALISDAQRCFAIGRDGQGGVGAGVVAGQYRRALHLRCDAGSDRRCRLLGHLRAVQSVLVVEPYHCQHGQRDGGGDRHATGFADVCAICEPSSATWLKNRTPAGTASVTEAAIATRPTPRQTGAPARERDGAGSSARAALTPAAMFRPGAKYSPRMAARAI